MMSAAILLPRRLDTAAAPALAERLASETGPALVLDGREVRVLGALCAQLLLAAEREAAARVAEFTLRPSDEMRGDLRLLGLSSLLAAAPGTSPGGGDDA